MSEIVNKVKQSKLVTIDLEKISGGRDVLSLDISRFLFKGLILKEEMFRESLKQEDWSVFSGEWVALYCSTDAIIPTWAWVLVTTFLNDHASEIVYGPPEVAAEQQALQRIEDFDWEPYRDKFVLLKGCSKEKVSPGVFMAATKKLMPVASKLMYGEACSNVPIYRR